MVPMLLRVCEIPRSPSTKSPRCELMSICELCIGKDKFQASIEIDPIAMREINSSGSVLAAMSGQILRGGHTFLAASEGSSHVQNPLSIQSTGRVFLNENVITKDGMLMHTRTPARILSV